MKKEGDFVGKIVCRCGLQWWVVHVRFDFSLSLFSSLVPLRPCLTTMPELGHGRKGLLFCKTKLVLGKAWHCGNDQSSVQRPWVTLPYRAYLPSGTRRWLKVLKQRSVVVNRNSMHLRYSKKYLILALSFQLGHRCHGPRKHGPFIIRAPVHKLLCSCLLACSTLSNLPHGNYVTYRTFVSHALYSIQPSSAEAMQSIPTSPMLQVREWDTINALPVRKVIQLNSIPSSSCISVSSISSAT